MNNKLKNFFTKRNTIILIGVLVILSWFLFFRGNNQNTNDIYSIKAGDFEKQIQLSGKVVSAESVELAFDTSGVVAAVYKKAGDNASQGEILAALDSSDLQASRSKAQADLLAAQAELNKLQSNTDSTEVLNNKQSLVDAISDAYIKSDDAIKNKTDQYFKDGDSSAPEIKYSFDNYFDLKAQINSQRVVVGETLLKWSNLVSTLTAENYSSQALSDSRKYILQVKNFLDLVAPAVNSFETSSELTQTSIDKYKSDLYSARSNVSSAISAMTSADEKLRTSISDIPVQEAKVKAAQANVDSYNAQIKKTLIVAPFSGVVSLQDAKAGESVSSNAKIAAMISPNYEIELYVPEINILGVKLGDKGTVTLDAYPNKNFEATVSHIDPAETLKDGVANYKVKLAFNTNDPLIRSGMTADVVIVTETRQNILVVPERATINENGKIFVWKKVSGEKNPVKTEISLGEKDGKGNAEVIGGVSEGDNILLTPITQ